MAESSSRLYSCYAYMLSVTNVSHIYMRRNNFDFDTALSIIIYFVSLLQVTTTKKHLRSQYKMRCRRCSCVCTSAVAWKIHIAYIDILWGHYQRSIHMRCIPFWVSGIDNMHHNFSIDKQKNSHNHDVWCTIADFAQLKWEVNKLCLLLFFLLWKNKHSARH